MSDGLAELAVNRVIRSLDELKASWDGSTIDANLQQLLQNLYRDVEDALDYMPDFDLGGPPS